MSKNIKITDERIKREIDININNQKYNAEYVIDNEGDIEIHDIYVLVNGPLTTECVELEYDSNIYNQIYSYLLEYLEDIDGAKNKFEMLYIKKIYYFKFMLKGLTYSAEIREFEGEEPEITRINVVSGGTNAELKKDSAVYDIAYCYIAEHLDELLEMEVGE